jgi:hypothetical protein
VISTIWALAGQSVLPGRGQVVPHRVGKENPVVYAMSTSYGFIALIILLAGVYVVVRFGFTRKRQLARRALGRRHGGKEMTGNSFASIPLPV